MKNKIDGLINERLLLVSEQLAISLSELKDVMTIPVERLQSAMTKDGFVSYCKIRTELLDIFSLVEVLVGSADGELKCVYCGASAKVSTMNGKEMLMGEITHWIENGRVVHDFSCDSCKSKHDVI